MLPKKTSPNISKNYSNRKKGILKRFDLKLILERRQHDFLKITQIFESAKNRKIN